MTTRSLFDVLLVWLIALALPLHGAAKAMAVDCHVLHRATEVHGNPSLVGDAAKARLGNGKLIEAIAIVHPCPGEFSPGSESSHDQKHADACGACCAGALPAYVANFTPDSTAPNLVVVSGPAEIPSLISDGLERPPRLARI